MSKLAPEIVALPYFPMILPAQSRHRISLGKCQPYDASLIVCALHNGYLTGLEVAEIIQVTASTGSMHTHDGSSTLGISQRLRDQTDFRLQPVDHL
jgi:hypothetical protein